ncbi:MAG TPA: hypothetical protein VNS58_14030 [Puia sp.]|nr:hypothetical protein [Puia sp.]
MPDMDRILLFFLCFFFVTTLRAQDTLPRFSVAAKGTGKILVSWRNNYKVVTQISIQRSTDSLRNFTTLITVPDPKLPENGAMDTRAPHPNFYYRLFIVLEEGKYLFTRSQRPGANTGESKADLRDDEDDTDPVLSRADHQRILFTEPDNNKGKPQVKSPSSITTGTYGSQEIEVKRTIFIKKGDSLIAQISGNRIRQFRDSLLTKTKDTLIFIDGDSLLIRPFVPKEVYRVSSYVFTGKYGNVHLSLPETTKRHYSVKFFDDTNKLLFELLEIKDTSLILDKSNFLHAGWFSFELYDGEQLKEKNKLFIPKEF